MSYGSVPNTDILIPSDELGPNYSIGTQPIPIDLVQQQMVSGYPSVQEIHVWQSPRPAYGVGADEFAYQIQPWQQGHVDLYSWRVHAPPDPVSIPYDEIAYQIMRNNMVVASGIILQSPAVPTGGNTAC